MLTDITKNFHPRIIKINITFQRVARKTHSKHWKVLDLLQKMKQKQTHIIFIGILMKV